MRLWDVLRWNDQTIAISQPFAWAASFVSAEDAAVQDRWAKINIGSNISDKQAVTVN